MLSKPLGTLSDNSAFQSDNLNSVINNNNLFILKKHDLNTTVGIIKGSSLGLEKNLFVKRFNSRGLLDFILRKFLGSRAKRLYKINLRLISKELPVPSPLLIVNTGFRQKNSFFISSVIENSDNLGNIYKTGMFNKTEKIADILGKTISGWHMSGAVHGDLKWSNILMQKDDNEVKFFLVDLDHAKLCNKLKIKSISRDLVRFYRYGLELGAEDWVNSQFFPAYMSSLSDEIKLKINLVDIKIKALKIWENKGRKTLKVD